MSACSRLIDATERKWLEIVFRHSREVFSHVHLPSHDHIHHMRVWEFAKEILQNLDNVGIAYSGDEIEVLIIAIFFHDMGMVMTHKKEHGFESRRLCRDFFRQNPALSVPDLDNALHIIETHDEKNYASISASGGKPALHTVLNISDDLDAFGAIGVYRYAEIYFLRGITVDKMPSAVIPNLDRRFDHFRQHLAFLTRLVDRHRLRYEYTRRFFQVLAECYGPKLPEAAAHMKVLKVLTEFSGKSELSIQHLLSLAEDKSLDPFTARYFHDFRDEWNCAAVR